MAGAIVVLGVVMVVDLAEDLGEATEVGLIALIKIQTALL